MHGQQIAQSTVVAALTGYRQTEKPPKALAMSFHGLQGSGKNFVAEIIAQTFYKEGTKSKFYHFFNGRSYAPVPSRLQEYKVRNYCLTNSVNNTKRNVYLTLFI